MSALLERPPTAAPAPSRRGLRGPLWVSVRQHRTALLIAVGAAVVGTLTLLAFRIWAGNAAENFAATGCSVSHGTRACNQSARDFSDAMFGVGQLTRYGSLVLQLLPGVLGAFLAGPVVARELESGTYKLAWTQSVGPTRWLASKLLPAVVLVLLFVPPLTAARAWVASWIPEYLAPHWFETREYVALGTVPVAYALLGIALGALIGLLVARTVPAMSVAVLGLGGIILVLDNTRRHFWPSRSATGPLDGRPLAIGDESWMLDGGWITADGERWNSLHERLRPCDTAVRDGLACVRELGVTGHYVDHHPASHFWPLQLVETGIVLALAAGCAFAAFQVVRRRHG